MKFNLKVTIEEVVEQYDYGVLEYGEVQLSCCRSTGDTSIKQGDDEILLELEQAKQLYVHLKYVFGD